MDYIIFDPVLFFLAFESKILIIGLINGGMKSGRSPGSRRGKAGLEKVVITILIKDNRPHARHS